MKALLTVWILISFASLSIKAQDTSGFKKEVYVLENDTLPYRLQYPEHYDKRKHYPVIVFLHGGGQTGSDNERQLIGVPKALISAEGRTKYACFILAPQCAKKDVWVKFPNFPQSLVATGQPTKSAFLTLQLLAKLLQQIPIDKKRIYITGYSMGGEGTFDFLTRKPHLFAAAIPICAVADTAKAGLIYQTPIWAFHGDQDDVNNVKYSRMMIDALKKQGGKPIYTEYPGIKHNSWTMAYTEPTLFDWLFAQKRDQ